MEWASCTLFMKKEDYHNILVRQMVPSARALFPDGNYVFQQDNDPKHTAKINKAYIERRRIPSMDWPSQSPNLNPIENLWSILDTRLKHRRPQSSEELFQMLLAGWRELPVDLLTTLADSMVNRVRDCIENDGWATKY